MRRRNARRIAAVCFGIPSLVLAVAGSGKAQTWHWNALTHTGNAPPLAAQSTVSIAGGNVSLTYTVPLQNRQVVIESCRAAIADVGNASTIVTAGRAFLLVQLKPLRSAACVSGRRPAVALPTDDRNYADTVAQAIIRSCCKRAGATAPPAAVARLSPSPRPSAAASPTAAPKPAAPRTRDWVETQGLFSFVRVRNAGPSSVTIHSGRIFDCRGAGGGCGAIAGDVTLDPGRVATLATVTASGQSELAAFRYEYAVDAGGQTSLHSGSSGQAAPRSIARMSAGEIRAAQAIALGGLRSPATAPTAAATPTFSPPRLIKRGSSRLAIGQTGTVLVRLTIGDSGTPQEATIVKISNRRLAAAAIETAVSSSYAPALQNGKPVAAKYVATFSFDGEDPATAGIPVWKRSPLPTASPIPALTPEPALTPDPEPATPLPTASPLSRFLHR